MTEPPTFSVPPSFLGVKRYDRDAAVCIAGIPLDIGTTNRSGSRFGPQAVRQASRMLVDGAHPFHWVEPAASPALSDIGDFAIALGDIPASLALIEAQAATISHLVAIGGEHTVSLALLRALSRRHGPLAVVQFDAHVDTWPESFGQPWGHGSVFYHAINEGLVDPQCMVQVGIRSPVQKDVYEWTLAQGVNVLDAEAVHAMSPAALAERVRSVLGSRPAYLSFDIDALDPAFAPGTGTPECGGISTWQAQAALRKLGGVHFVGMDLVEVAPPYDVAETTALAAATMIWEYLALLGRLRWRGPG
jgi:agmatinase